MQEDEFVVAALSASPVKQQYFRVLWVKTTLEEDSGHCVGFIAAPKMAH